MGGTPSTSSRGFEPKTNVTCQGKLVEIPDSKLSDKRFNKDGVISQLRLHWQALRRRKIEEYD